MLILRTINGKKLYEADTTSWTECVHMAQREKVGLDYANLSYRDLSAANFDRCSLTHASFVGSNLRRASFFRANLHGANMQAANASAAQFGESSLFMANCRHCVFDDANLRSADCRRTDFSFASFDRTALHLTLFVEADFTQAHVSTARAWSAVQFFDEQLQHYRDDLWLLLYRHPLLAGPLYGAVGAAEANADVEHAQLTPLPGVAQVLLASIGEHEDVENAIAQRYWACHWFRQFASRRDGNVIAITRRWIQEWLAENAPAPGANVKLSPNKPSLRRLHTN